MDLIHYKGLDYPSYQAQGYATKFAIPYAKQYCTGFGYDIGCMSEDWKFPGSIGIDLSFNDGYDAFNLPTNNVDYIYSSHCLEHIPNWVDAMDYWYNMLRVGGTLFLYLPHFSQIYWRSWNNRKHLHDLSIEIIIEYMKDRGYVHIFNSDRDLNNSFMVVGEKGIQSELH